MARRIRRDKDVLGRAGEGGGNKESVLSWKPIEESVSREKLQSTALNTIDKFRNLVLNIELSNMEGINKLIKGIICGCWVCWGKAPIRISGRSRRKKIGDIRG